MRILDRLFRPNVERLERKRDFQGLLEALRYPRDAEVREKAARALDGVGGARAVDALAAGLGDRDRHVGRACAQALGRIGDTRAVDALLAGLTVANGEVRWDCAEVLGPIADARTLDTLLLRLEDPGGEVRRICAFALGKTSNPRAVEALAAGLEDQDETVRIECALALGTIGDARVVDALARGLEDDVLGEACEYALEQIGDPMAREALARFKEKAPRVTEKVEVRCICSLPEKHATGLSAERLVEVLRVCALFAGNEVTERFRIGASDRDVMIFPDGETAGLGVAFIWSVPSELSEEVIRSTRNEWRELMSEIDRHGIDALLDAAK